MKIIDKQKKNLPSLLAVHGLMRPAQSAVSNHLVHHLNKDAALLLIKGN